MRDGTMVAPISEHLGFLLRQAQLIAFQDFQETTIKFGLTPAEYSVLAIVGDRPGIRQNRLTDLLAIKPPNCVILVNKLEGANLLRREKLPISGRAVALSLTEDGKSLLVRINEKVADHLCKMERRLGPTETRALIRLLSRFVGTGESSASSTIS